MEQRSHGSRRTALTNALSSAYHTSMPLDDDAISALSKPELRVRLNECHQARVAERVEQRAEMMTGATATEYDASSCVARILVSETTIQ